MSAKFDRYLKECQTLARPHTVAFTDPPEYPGIGYIPRRVEIQTTSRCNLRCKVCPYYGVHRKPPRQEDMPPALYTRAIESLRKMSRIAIEQGAPPIGVSIGVICGDGLVDTLVKDRVRELNTIEGIFSIVGTNGIAFEHMDLSDFNPHVVYMSILGAVKGEIPYTWVSGISMDRIARILDQLVAHDISVVIVHGIYNTADLGHSLAFFAGWPSIPIYVHPLILNAAKGPFSEDDVLRAAPHAKNPVFFNGIVGRRAYGRQYTSLTSPHACEMIYSETFVTAAGNIHFCCSDSYFEFPIASLYEHDILDAFNSEHMRMLRAREHARIPPSKLCMRMCRDVYCKSIPEEMMP